MPELLAVLQSEIEPDLVAASLIALAKIGDAPGDRSGSTLKRIAPYLSSPIQTIAESATLALGILGDSRAMWTLIDQLTDEVGTVPMRTRAFSAYALGLLGSRLEDMSQRRAIVKALWRACRLPRQPTPDMHTAAILAMGLVPLESTPTDLTAELPFDELPRSLEGQVCFLLHLFSNDGSPRVSYLAACHATRSIGLLLEGQQDPALKNHVVASLAPYVTKRGNLGQREKRQCAALLFGMIGDTDDDPADVLIRERLQEASGNADIQVKNFCLIALGQVGGRAGTLENTTDGRSTLRSFLWLHLERGKTTMQPWACLALGALERESASLESLAKLRSATQTSSVPGRAETARIALSIVNGTVPAERIGRLDLTQLSIADCIAGMDDRSSSVAERAAYVMALGTLADKDPVSWHARYSIGLNYRACTDTLADIPGNGLLNLY